VLSKLHDVDLALFNLLSEWHHGGIAAHVRQISARVPLCCVDKLLEVDSILNRNTLQIDLEKLLTAHSCRQRDINSLFKATSDSVIEVPRAVRCRQHHDVFLG